MGNFIRVAHDKRIEVTFDTQTIAYLHLFDKKVLQLALTSGFHSPFFTSWRINSDQPALQVRFSVERHGEAEVSAECLVNRDVYETLVRENSAFYVCSITAIDTSKPLGSYVIKETTRLTDLASSYARFVNLRDALNERMDHFIEKHSLCEAIDVAFFDTRKKEIGQWLEDLFMDHGLLIQFEDGDTSHTMRHLLTSTVQKPQQFLDLMLGKCDRRTKRTVNIICQEIKCNEPYLVDFCRRNPELVANLSDYNIALRETPSGIIDIARVKDDDDGDTLLSMSILDRPDFNEIVAKITSRKRFSLNCKEAIDEERRIAYHEKKNLVDQCKQLLLPYFDNEVKHFFGPEYGEVDICPEVIDVCLKRVDNLADREKGLDGASRVVKGCIMHTMIKAKNVLDERRDTSMEQETQSGLALKKAIIPLDAFDKTKQANWSSAIVKLVQDNENRRALDYHQLQKTDITTLNLMQGKDSISSSILPCVNNITYNMYVNNSNNNNIIINFDKKECYTMMKAYSAAIDEIIEVEDIDRRRAMKAELESKHGMPTKYKRTRTARNEPDDSPVMRKKLKTKHEATQVDDENDTRPVIIITSERVPKQTPQGNRECECCDVVKPLTAFYNKSSSYAYLRNVCHSCITRKKKVDKTCK